jgi:hypothetical protein
MLKDARADVAEAQGRVLSAVRELPSLRESLLAARETLTWVAAYPAPAESFGTTSDVALGLREPLERTLSTKAWIAYSRLIEALEEDAAALASQLAHSRRSS